MRVAVEAIILGNYELYVSTLSQELDNLMLFERVKSFDSLEALIKYLTIHKPSPYFFIDYSIEEPFESSFINTIREICRSSKLIIIVSFSNPVLIRDLAKHKPDSIFHKTDNFDNLKNCILAVNEGKTYQSDFVKYILEKNTTTRKSIFTPREIDLLPFFARGYTTNGTAQVLGLSPNTVIVHRRKMFEKSNSSNIFELLTYAKKKGLI